MSEPLSEHTRRSLEGHIVGAAFTILVDIRKSRIHFGELLDAFPSILVTLGQVLDEVRLEELVLAIVEGAIGVYFFAAGFRNAVDGLQNVDVERNLEAVTAIFIGEEVVEVVKARPGNSRKAQRTGLVGCEEYTLFGARALVLGNFEELFDAVHLTVPHGVFNLVVGFCDDQAEVVFAENGGSKELVTILCTNFGLGHYIFLDDVKKTIDINTHGYTDSPLGR